MSSSDDLVAGWWDVEEDAYHASGLVSRGKLQLLRKSPQEFHARVIARSLPSIEPTKALRVGRLLHVAVLQPDRWEREFCLPPAADIAEPEPAKPVPAEGTSANTKAHRENLARWREEMAAWSAKNEAAIAEYLRGREIVKPDEWATVMGCAHAIAGHRPPGQYPASASWLLSDVDFTERSLRWQDEDTGIWCRARVDAFTCDEHEDRCADLKSFGLTPTPDAFRREIVSHWYHGQAAFYTDGCRSVTERTPRFPFVVVHKDEPHEVAIFELGDEETELGRRQYKAALAELAWRLERDEWLAAWSAEPHVIRFDQWTFRAAEEWSSSNG